MANAPVDDLPKITPHIFSGVNLYPHQQLIEIKTRAPLAIHDSVCVVPYVVIEGIFSTLLAVRLQQSGMNVTLQPMTNTTPT